MRRGIFFPVGVRYVWLHPCRRPQISLLYSSHCVKAARAVNALRATRSQIQGFPGCRPVCATLARGSIQNRSSAATWRDRMLLLILEAERRAFYAITSNSPHTGYSRG